MSPTIAEPVSWQEILGYLNFSSGASDPAFLRRLNELWEVIESAGAPADQSWKAVHQSLVRKLQELSATSAAFRDSQQARDVLRLVFDEVLPAYRRHHRDLLFHQSEAALWRPFFVGRLAEAVLAEGGPWEERDRIVAGALSRLNDYLGHRPVAVLETHKHEPYDHERVRPVPLYIAGAGVAVGKYHDMIEETLRILRDTKPEILEAAWFDPDAVEELAFDPRAYDFNHPANRRPNYHFGQWDPHVIDNKGRYRRFVVQQTTLDAVLGRIERPGAPGSHDQLVHEAGAVLAGTILMASGTSGRGPETHDSTVTLATLLPHIARYRDEFYQQLFDKLQGQHRARLQAEATARQQPFAGARQHLNGELARLRALQMQHVHLALLFARLGFAQAAMRQAQIVPAASARMLCEIQCLLTAGHRHADAGRLNDGFAALGQAEDLLRRAIACGAIVDPWNILGFGGQFSLFPAVENSIPDPRVDELLDLMEQVFSLASRLWYEAALVEDQPLQKRISADLGKLAGWWDAFATGSVSGVRHISGAEAHAAAQRVAGALAAWHKAGAESGKLSFWRPQADEFDSPRAYGRVIESLLDKPDLQAAQALLMHWLSQADRISLGEGRRSFFALVVRWVQLALAADHGAALVLKFFDHLEANAESYWNVPDWQSEEMASADERKPATQSLDEEDAGEEDDLFSAAYEGMVYRDSTADGIDADMLEGGGSGDSGNDELERQQHRLAIRLAFLATLAGIWKLTALAASAARHPETSHREAAGPDAPAPPGSPRGSAELEVPAAWLARAADNRRRLQALAVAIQRQPIAVSSATYDALVDYDRRRVMREILLDKVIATLVATSEAEVVMTAVVRSPADATPAGQAAAPPAAAQGEAAPPIGQQALAVWTAVLAGNVAAVREHWAAFLAESLQQTLLYVPLARGGDPRKIAAARTLQHSFRELLRRLPRLGLLRETCQLLRVARAMEKNHPQGPGAVTEFDRLFEVGYKAIVESLVEASLGWQANGGGPKGSAKVGRKSSTHRAAAADAQLIDCMQQITESLLNEWLSHSRTLRLSVLERVSAPKAWQELVGFITRYGRDLFTQQFLHLGNLRGILHLGIDHWLEHVAQDEESGERHKLVSHLDHGLSRAEARKHLSLIIEAIVENYTEYRDYNATTTQSDRGDMLYALLDFSRVKVGYERIHWNLRPVMMAHEVLVRRGCASAAELWRRAIAERTADAADGQLKRLAEVQTQYGMRLPTIADRLAERFVRPLAIDRIRALVGPAADEARHGAAPAAFTLLEQEASELAQEPCGAGLDSPEWLELLEDEVDRACNAVADVDSAADWLKRLPWVRLSWEEIQSQLANWDTPPEINK